MYFGTGGAADGTGQAYACKGESIVSIQPTLVTTTTMLVATTDEQIDEIVFTHPDTTTTSGHKCREIAQAMAEGANASAHVNGITDMVDLDNSIFYGNLKFITGVSISIAASLDY